MEVMMMSIFRFSEFESHRSIFRNSLNRIAGASKLASSLRFNYHFHACLLREQRATEGIFVAESQGAVTFAASLQSEKPICMPSAHHRHKFFLYSAHSDASFSGSGLL